MSKVSVVFISGFLTPSQWISYPKDLIPDGIEMIPVFPSPTASLHDRVCEVFYELVGGRVDYGEEHSTHYNHERFGKKYEGKLTSFCEEHPIIVVGHSMGALTARVLHHYLATKRFPGYDSNAHWIQGIVTINAPFNGALQVYSKGLCSTLPPLVKWASQGCIVGWFVHLTAFLGIHNLHDIFDFGQAKWRLDGSIESLILAFYGFCMHSNTDNISYDASIQCQDDWSKVLQTFPSTFYYNIIGKVENSSFLLNAIHGHPPPFVHGIDTSTWLLSGHDGLISVFSQEFPRLNPDISHPHRHIGNQIPDPNDMLRGVWYITHHNIGHLTASFACKKTWQHIWSVCLQMAKAGQLESDSSKSSRKAEFSGNIECAYRPDIRVIDFHSSRRELPQISLITRIIPLLFCIPVYVFDSLNSQSMVPLVIFPFSIAFLYLWKLITGTSSSDEIEIFMCIFRIFGQSISPKVQYATFLTESLMLGYLSTRDYHNSGIVSKAVLGLLLFLKSNRSLTTTLFGFSPTAPLSPKLFFFLNIMIAMPKFAWKIVEFGESSTTLSSGSWKALFIGLMTLFVFFISRIYREIPRPFANVIDLTIVGSIAFILFLKMRDISESFQFVFIRETYKKTS